MALPARTGRILALVAAGFCAASCGRIGFELLPSDSQQAVTTDAGAGGGGRDAMAGAPNNGGSAGTSGAGGGPASGGNASGSGASSNSGGASGSGGTTTGGASSAGAGGLQSGGAPGTGGVAGAGGASSGGGSSGGTSSGGLPSTGGAPPDAGPPPVCASTSGTLKVWSFNSTVESWAFWPNVGAGTMAWTAAMGNPAAGALALDVTSGNGILGWIVMDAPAPNLTGHTASVWLWLDSPSNGSNGVKMYAQSNPAAYAWADGGFVTLPSRTWTCVTLNFSAPVYSDASFNPAQVVRFGVEVAGTGPLTLYADQLAY